MLAALVRRGHGPRWRALSWRPLEASGESRTSSETVPSTSPWPSSSPAWSGRHPPGINLAPSTNEFCRQQPPTLLPLAHWVGPSGSGRASFSSRGKPLEATAASSLAIRGLNAGPYRRALSQASAQRLVPRGGSRAREGRFSWKPLTLLWRSAVIASEIATLWVRRHTEPNISVRASKVRVQTTRSHIRAL